MGQPQKGDLTENEKKLIEKVSEGKTSFSFLKIDCFSLYGCHLSTSKKKVRAVF